jgi:hypothetical protein
MMPESNVKTISILLIITLLAVTGYWALNRQDQRTTGERMGDAVDAISDGVDKASRQLENRTPAEKLGDAVDDISDNIKE